MSKRVKQWPFITMIQRGVSSYEFANLSPKKVSATANTFCSKFNRGWITYRGDIFWTSESYVELNYNHKHEPLMELLVNAERKQNQVAIMIKMYLCLQFSSIET